ncbi:MAG: hypothetical protein ACP5II_04680 [Infirmifilum sp.]|jgi:hypothetical protein|uniref:hypothetical protein n=1 Tax=Infirmifilum TaxID=2856573 RepID=UPI002354A5CF
MFIRKLKLRLLQVVYEGYLKRSRPRLKRRVDWKEVDDNLALMLTPPAALLTVSPEELLSKIFQPFVDVIALLAAITFGIGIIGFILLILDAALSWVTGGSFGRSIAVSKFIRAAETLAILPLLFFVIMILNSLGIPEISSVAKIMENLLQRGWRLITTSLGG